MKQEIPADIKEGFKHRCGTFDNRRQNKDWSEKTDAERRRDQNKTERRRRIEAQLEDDRINKEFDIDSI